MADTEKLAGKVSDLWVDAMEALEALLEAMKETHPSVAEDYAETLMEKAQDAQDDVEDLASSIKDSHLDDEDLYDRLEEWGKL